MSPGADPQLLTLTLGDDPSAWADAGFSVDGNTVALGSTALVLTGEGGGFLGWAFDAADGAPAARPDGVAGLGGCATVRPGQQRPHPNGISRIDHVVVMAHDLGVAVDAFTSDGFECRREHGTEVMGRPARQAFFWAGDVILEVVGPATTPEPSDGPAMSIFGLALVADDLAATAAFLGDRMGTPRPAVQQGREIATLRSGPLGMSLPVAVMSPHRQGTH